MQIESWIIQGNSFHFGQHGLGQENTAESLHSDSLFAALLAVLGRSAGQAAVDDFMAGFLAGSPPFVISSTFPAAGEVRFYPLPRCALRVEEGSTVPAKTLKKVSYVSESLFRRILMGYPLAGEYEKSLSLQGGGVLVGEADLPKLPESLRQEDSRLWIIEQRPRVTLGRKAQNSSIFSTGRLAFTTECGLWFGVRWLVEDALVKARMAALLAELADAGLGAERSVGFGACIIQPAGEVELPNGRGLPWVALSSYLPRPEEMPALADPAAAYSLRQVGGWLDSPVRSGQRRRPVRFLAEGSVLGALAVETPGRVVDVRPSYPTDPDPLGHPVYRCGLALAVGFQGGSK